MKKLSHITESIWTDIQKRSSGEEIRQEDEAKLEPIKDFIKRHHLKKMSIK